MPSLKKTRDVLLLSHDLGYINDEEFLLLYEVNHSDNLIFNATSKYKQICEPNKQMNTKITNLVSLEGPQKTKLSCKQAANINTIKFVRN